MLLGTVRKRKLRWAHENGTMILQGTVEERRRKGRQKERWEDNISGWTGLKLGEVLRKAENREEWRKVVGPSSLMPKRSLRLRDR